MAQHGAYMLLLWEYYINGPIEANASGLLGVCCGKNEAELVDVTYVLERFFVLKDGFWHNERADEEIEKRASIREKRKLLGKKGGLAKATNLLKQKARQSQSHIKTLPLTEKVAPEGLHPMQYAAHICDELVIPTKGNMETVAGTVETLAKSMKTSHREAHDYLLAKALTAKEAGETVNLFWFRDGKYNITRRKGDSYPQPTRLGRVSAQHERAANNLAAAAAAFGGSDMDAHSAGDRARQTARLSAGHPPTLEGKTS